MPEQNQHTVFHYHQPVLVPIGLLQLITKFQTLSPALCPTFMYLIGHMATARGLLLAQTPEPVVLGSFADFLSRWLRWILTTFIVVLGTSSSFAGRHGGWGWPLPPWWCLSR